MTITSENQQNTIINANHSGTIFTIAAGVNVIISNLTLTKVNVTSYSGGVGGAISNYGLLTIKNCTLKDNTAVYVSGAIYNWGTLTIINSTLQNNTATKFKTYSGGHGGAILNDGTLTITNSIFNDNHADDNGGAIYNDGTLTVTNTTFKNNTATSWGGGAICNYGNLTVTYSTLQNNSASYGGAIYNYYNTSIKYSLITGNTAPTGSAIDSGSGTVNAEYNWWGSNNNPSGIIIGNVNATPWLASPINVNSINPSNNTVNLPLNQMITVTFSEPIKTGNTSIQLENSNNTPISFTTNIDGNILTIKPSLLVNNTKYTLILPTGSITDLAGNPLNYYTTNFSTGPLPLITSINPTNGAVNVATNNNITLTFNKPIKSGNMSIQLENSNNTPVSFTTNINGNILTIKPTLLSNNTKYTLILHTGSITDLAGNPLSLSNTNFITGPLPIVTNISPINTVANSTNKVIKITFNTPIKAGNMSIQLKNNNGSPLPFTTSIKGNVLTLTSNLSYHYIYYVNPTATPSYDLNAMKKTGITDVFMLVSPHPGDSNYYGTYLPQIKPLFDNAGITLHAWIFPDFTTQDVSKIAAMGVNIHLDLEFGYFPSTEYVTNFVTTMRAACTGRIFTVAVNPNAPNTDSGAVYGDDYSLLAQHVDAIVPMLYKGNYNLSDATMTSATAYMQKEAPGKLWIALQSYQSDSNATPLSANSVLTQINDVKANANGIASFRYGLSNFETAISTLITNPKYTLILHTGSITDLAGNPLTPISFTINNTIKPTIITTNPNSNATGVSLTTPVTITFNENINAGANFTGIYIKNITTGSIVSLASEKISGNILTINTTSNHLSNDTYQVYIPAGAVKDAAGNTLPAAYTYTFHTIK